MPQTALPGKKRPTVKKKRRVPVTKFVKDSNLIVRNPKKGTNLQSGILKAEAYNYHAINVLPSFTLLDLTYTKCEDFETRTCSLPELVRQTDILITPSDYNKIVQLQIGESCLVNEDMIGYIEITRM